MKVQVIIKTWKVDKANDTYLLFFLDVLFVLLKSHAEFACSNFAIIGFVEADIFSLSLPNKILTTYALRSYAYRMWVYLQLPSRTGL